MHLGQPVVCYLPEVCHAWVQTKETLTLRTSSFGSKCDVSDAKFLKKLDACGITELVNAFATFKNEKELKKTDGAKRQRITGALPVTLTPTPVCLRCIAPIREG